MPKRTDLATDIAMVGVWDPDQDRPDLRSDQYSNDLSHLQAQAKAGRLFFINTGGDGGFPTDIFVAQSPDPDDLALYNTPDRAFLIESTSGRLIAGGLEAFGNSNPANTNQEDAFSVTQGRYALRFYELDDEKYVVHLRQHLGDADMEYYESKLRGKPWGFLLFVIAVVTLLAAPWFISTGFVLLWLIYVTIKLRRRTTDQRHITIGERIGTYESRFPSFLFVLTPVSDGQDIAGGWHDLF